MFAKFDERRRQAGDTIIEVMVVVAILGFAFSISYATATRSLNKTRNSQEHAEALQYLTSQIELLRNDATDATIASHVRFCMDPTTDKPVFISSGAYATVCNMGTSSRYALSISYQQRVPGSTAPQDDVYSASVAWEGIAGLGLQHENIYYKLHTL